MKKTQQYRVNIKGIFADALIYGPIRGGGGLILELGRGVAAGNFQMVGPMTI